MQLQAHWGDIAFAGAGPWFGHMAFHAVVDLARRYEPQDIEAAYEKVLRDFPVFDCRYVSGVWRDGWVRVQSPVTDGVVCLETSDIDAETSRWLRAELDPHVDRSLRVVYLASSEDERARFILTFLHITVDGAGAMAAAQAFAAHLHGVEPIAPPTADRSPRMLFERLTRLQRLGLAVRSLYEFVRPLRLAHFGARRDPFPPAATPTGIGTWHRVTLNPQEVAELRARAREFDATLNDALIAAMLLAHRDQHEGRRRGVIYTMDLRRYMRSARLASSNLSMVMMAETDPTSANSADAAWRAASSITKQHQRTHQGLAIMQAILLARALSPDAMTRWVHRTLTPRLLDTLLDRAPVLTNIGRLDDGLGPWGEHLVDVRIVGPTSRSARFAIVVASGLRGSLMLDVYSPPTVAADVPRSVAAAVADALAELTR